jgi:DNA-binding CsgD family transcriptional regulator
METTARPPILPGSRLLVTLVQSLIGRDAAAREQFAALTALDMADLFGPAYPIAAVTMLSETCVTLGDRKRAPAIYELLRPFAGRNVVQPYWPQFRGAVDHHLGLLAATMGDWDTAARHFDVGLAMHERVGARPYLARTQHAYASMLLERRRADDLHHARSLLEEAVAAFDDIGMVQDAAAARALLADPRAVVAVRPRPTYPDRLSEREVEVLRLVAAGKSNQEIADTLVISRNTVLRHVNHLYAKTGVANRVELANYAHRQDLSG